MINPTTNERIRDWMILHMVYLLRYSKQVHLVITQILDESESKVRDRILTNRGGAAGKLVSPRDWERLNSLVDAIGEIRGASWAKVSEYLAKEMVDFAYTEPQLVARILEESVPVVLEMNMPAPNQLRSIAMSRPFEGKTLREWASTMQSEDLRRIRSVIQAGMVSGETMPVIASRVLGTAQLAGSNGVTELARRQADGIVRTAINFIGDNARELLYEENSDIVDKEQFLATLDSRTTPICRSLDGNVYPRSKGPRPPLHWFCRSLRIPIIGENLAGERPAKPTTEKMLVEDFSRERGIPVVSTRSELPRGTKGEFDTWRRKRLREVVGPIPATQTYQTWLVQQSARFQDEVLGKTKGKLFREGGLTLDKFVHRNGDELTLRELSAKHADAFRKAGLNPNDY